MIQVYYSQLPTAFSKKKWMNYFEQMPDDIQQRIYRYRKTENKYQLLGGRLLLKYGMQQLGFNDFQLTDLYYDKNNYPLWREDIHFNIAHSRNIVACAFSKEDKIGIDIEQIKQINLNNFGYILNKIDQQAIAKSNNPNSAFFKIWTVKEAITKAIGKGLTIDVQQISVFEEYAVLNDQKWYYHPLLFDENFAAHLVSNNNDFHKLQVCKIEF